MPTRKPETVIPVHYLELSNPLGLEIARIFEDDPHDDITVQQAHRDDHYIFFLQESGNATMMVDFLQVTFKGKILGFILPGQVHHFREHIKAAGWFLAIDTAIIDARFRAVFENKHLKQQAIRIKDITAFNHCLELIHNQVKCDKEKFSVVTVHYLVNAFMAMAASAFTATNDKHIKAGSRVSEITDQFHKLLAQHFSTEKAPGAYANMLNISTGYLNEAVKKQTGFAVTYWIQRETMLEAKRLLYHTDLTVKEIAYRAGFDDHAYFSRLFRKTVKMTPLDFRFKYRESSNDTRR